MIDVNTILHTKDGRKIGNAIVTNTNEGEFLVVKTDYGNETRFTREEINSLFFVVEQNTEYSIPGYQHKYAITK